MGRWHAANVRAAGGRTVAIVDVDKDAACRLAAASGAHAFGDLEEALQRVQLDVVHICTPITTHVPLAARAIEAGIHALVEKPLAATVAETAELLRCAVNRGVLLCPVHQFPFQDGVRRAKQWMGKIGQLVHVEAMFCSAGAVNQPDTIADQTAADILPHPLSLIEALVPGGVHQTCWSATRHGAGELRISGQGGDATLSIFVSMRARPTVCALRLYGTAGTISLDLFHGFGFLEPGQVSRSRKLAQPFDRALRTLLAASANLARRTIAWQAAYPGLRQLIASFYDAVRTGSTAPIPPDEVIAIAELRERILRDVASETSPS